MAAIRKTFPWGLESCNFCITLVGKNTKKKFNLFFFLQMSFSGELQLITFVDTLG